MPEPIRTVFRTMVSVPNEDLMTIEKQSPLQHHAGSTTELSPEATKDINAALGALLADVFMLYVKTNNFHWHMSGPHFRMSKIITQMSVASHPFVRVS
jgi:hypothetical protein